MFIQTESTPNPATLKFLPGRDVLIGEPREFRGADEAAISPLATGNNQLLEMNPTEAAERKLSQFATENKSPVLKKYLDLSQQSLVASTLATKIEDALKLGPDTFVGGMEADLAELCIGSK